MIRGILFDLGGTLLEVTDPEIVIGSFLEEKGIQKTLQEISAAVSAADRSFSEDDFIGKDYWKEWNIRILTRLGIVASRESIASYIDDHWFEKTKVVVFPGTIEVLGKLRDMRIKIGAVTNGLASDLPHLIDDVGLSGYFDEQIAADQAGRRKPNPRLFLHAATRIGFPPSDILFVGDDPDLDYRPAESVGMTPVLIDRGKGKVLVKNVIEDLDGVFQFL